MVKKLKSQTGKTVADIYHSIMSEYGWPDTIVSNNGPCFISQEFKDLLHSKSVVHITSSPHYQQANRLAEKYVQVVKNLLKKATEEGKSPFDALHIYRNILLAKNKLSPMQILSGRCPQNDLPMSDSARLRYGRPISIPTEVLRDPKKESQANLHNFHLHQYVMFLQPDQKKWYPARVIELCKEPRSYIMLL